MFVVREADQVAWEMAIGGSKQVGNARRETSPEHLSRTNWTAP